MGCFKNVMIKISIVVPVYNVEKHIKKCIDSLLEQNFDDYEIIIVNDGTRDNSMDYVRQVQKKTDKIIIYEQENAGLSAARNSGIRLARGKYILFCDSDDALVQNCLLKLYNEMEANNLDLLIYDAELRYENEKSTHDNLYNRPNICEDIISGKEMLSSLLKDGYFLASSCLYIVQREILIKNGLRFEEGILHEDELFTPILLLYSQRVKHKNWMIYQRYIREGSIMTGRNLVKRMMGLKIVILKLIDYTNYNKLDKVEIYSLRVLIKRHIRHFLAQALLLKYKGIDLKDERGMIYKAIMENKLALGVKFWIYLCYLKVRYMIYGIKED